ncbi:unnamed protein product [Gordionus sp. m RMFG-2023]
MSGVPAFLAKLWALVEDLQTNDLIAWSETGMSFNVFNPTNFAKQVLPKYFKHNNMTSFVRQLNMYGFRKIASIEQGSLKTENENIEFFHPYFIRSNPHLLEHIKRKPTFKPESGNSTSAVYDMIQDVSNIKERQMDLESKMDDIKRENTTLWDEVLYLRQKYNKQQIIVKKLIQFLLAMIKPISNLKMKKKMPLMLNNNTDYTRNKYKAVVEEPKYYINMNDSNSLESTDAKDITNNSITTDMGLPSDGLFKDIYLNSEGSNHFIHSPSNSSMINENIIDDNNFLKSSKLIDLNDPVLNQSPLMEVEVDSYLMDMNLNHAQKNVLTSFGQNIQDLEDLDLIKDIINVDENNKNNHELNAFHDIKKNQTPNKIKYNIEDNKITSISQEKQTMKYLPIALRDHIIVDYIDDLNSNENKNEDKTKSNNIKHKPSTSNILNAVSTTKLDSYLDDIYEQIYNIIDDQNCFNNNNYLDNGYNNGTIQNSSQDLVPSRDLNYNSFNDFNNIADMKDILTQANISIDTKLLLDLMRNIDNNDFLNPPNELLSIENGDISYENEISDNEENTSTSLSINTQASTSSMLLPYQHKSPSQTNSTNQTNQKTKKIRPNNTIAYDQNHMNNKIALNLQEINTQDKYGNGDPHEMVISNIFEDENTIPFLSGETFSPITNELFSFPSTETNNKLLAPHMSPLNFLLTNDKP